MSNLNTQLGPLSQLLEPILLLDKEYTILDLNETACNLLQTSKEAFIGETFPFDLRLDQGLEVELPSAEEQLNLYIVQSQSFSSNKEDCILVRFFKAPNKEANLKNRKDNFKIALFSLVNQLNLPAIITEENGFISSSTKAAQRLLSVDEQQLRGQSAIQIIDHAPSLEIKGKVPLSKKFTDLLSREKVPQSNVKLELKLKNDCKFELLNIALDTSLSASFSNHLIIFNMSDLQKEASNHAACDSRQFELMAAGIAHDFKNLLSSIISHISIARLKIENIEATEKIDAAEEAAWQAKTLSLRLMNISDPRKHLENPHAAYSLAGLMRSCVHMHLKNSQISYELLLDEPLWDCSVEYTQMTQVINNLLINAQQAMPTGGHIEIKATNAPKPQSKEKSLYDKQQDFICLRIRDTGPGISTTDQIKIFEPYFTTKARGNGIGLANCKNIIEAHKGHLHVESIIGQGTTFIIHIPRAYTPVPEKK